MLTVKRCKPVERQLNTELEMEEYRCFCFLDSFLTGISIRFDFDFVDRDTGGGCAVFVRCGVSLVIINLEDKFQLFLFLF